MTIYQNMDFSSNNWVTTFPYGQTKDTVQALAHLAEIHKQCR
jgi:hypothetical protein